MRLWTLHPKYLDRQGLVALWRETLLAKKVLEGATIGYKSHPQLLRFKKSDDPLVAVNYYLSAIYNEATERGYAFDATKFTTAKIAPSKIQVTSGQLHYEFLHLMRKLRRRSFDMYQKMRELDIVEAGDMFEIVDGVVEKWEII